MKKKCLLLLGIFVLLLGVTGCGSDNNFDYDSAKKIIEDNMKDLKDIDDETLEDVYNLDLSKMDKHVFRMNDDGDFYAIIETKEINNVKTNMKDYFEKVEKFNKNYSPERIKLLNNRVEKEIDNYLIYIIHNDADDIYKKIIDEM